MSQSISFAYNATTSTGTTQCRLLDYNKAPLTAYATNNPISYTSPSASGQYTYYVECRNTTHPTANTVSNAISVNVFSCNAVTDVPVAECDALMNIYNTTGGASWSNTVNNDNKWGISTTVGNWYGVDVWGGHVVGLGLSYNNLSGSFQITTGNLDFVTQLDVTGNNLTALSTSGLSGLTTLD